LFHDLPDSSAAPVSFGPFRVLHQIGVGVLGPVYRAQDSVRDQLVAVKAFKIDAPPEQAEEIADALQTVAQAMPRHRGLLEYIAAGVERTTPYLVMAHSDVPSLDTKLKPGVPLDAEEALDLIATLADAIDSAHSRGIIHGTLHPRDVFVDDRGGCRVSGFGVATTLAHAGIKSVPIRRPYSPPERVAGGPIERSADLFALGAIVFELFSGRRVVGTGRDAAVRCAVSAPDVDVEHLRTALAAMLAENPAHRPSSAISFAQAITQAVRPRGLTAASARKRVTPTEIPSELKLRADEAAAAAGAAAMGAGASESASPSESGLSESGAAPAPQDHAEAHAGEEEGPTRDALELFTRQGTLWEANRRAKDEPTHWETVSVAPGEDPLAQFAPESETRASEPPAPAALADAAAAAAAAGRSAETSRRDMTAPFESEDAAAANAVRAGGQPSAPGAQLPETVALDSSRGTPGERTSTSTSAQRASTDVGRAAEEQRAAEAEGQGAAGEAAGEAEPEVSSIADAARHVARAAGARASAAREAATSAGMTRARAAATPPPPGSGESAAGSARRDRDLLAAAAAAAFETRSNSPLASPEPDRSAASRHARHLDHEDLQADASSTATGPRFLEDDLEHLPTTPHVPPRVTTATPVTGAAGLHATAGPRGWVVPTPEEPEETGSNPLRVLLLVLTIGLAVGVAGGYLLGQRSGRQALALLRGESLPPETEQAAAPAPNAPDQPSAPDKTSAPSSSAATSPSSAAGATAPGASPSPPAASASAPGAAAHGAPRGAERSDRAERTPADRAASRSESARATTGRLVVQSSPGRAEVLVNGVKRGETPLTLRNLPLGTHTIRVSRGGYQTSTRKVTLTASRAADSLAFDLQPMEPRAGAAREAGGTAGSAATGGDPDSDRASAEATAAGLGALYVLSHPAGARVIVDGQVVGTTPLVVTNVPPGNKTVRLELPGHKPWSSTVRVAAGQRVRVAASLEDGTN
jgi:hypothetical protein